MKHRRDPEGHRAAILTAAREAFAEKGFSRATVRDIAGRAGVTHGLVLKQFGTKEQLFLAAVPGHRELDQTVSGDRETLPERVAQSFIQRMEDNAGGDPLIVLMRSVASDQAAAAELLATMYANSAEAYAEVLGDAVEDVPARVAMLGAQLVGVTFSRYIARTGPLAEMSADDVADHLGRTLRHILFSS